MSYAKQKGKELEDYVEDQIVEKGIDTRARRDGASGAGTREKGDIQTSMMILNQNAGIECKNHKTIHIKEWWNQTKKLESLSREPMLVYKIQGQGMEETLCTMYLDTVLELIKASRSPKIEPQSTQTTYTDNTLKWKTQPVINELKELLKLL